MNQSIIEHIRTATPKGRRNRCRKPSNQLGYFFILSIAGMGISGLMVIILSIIL